MKTPTISIITSTYNRSKRLRRAITSIQNQSFKDYEHIIVDDCSTDNTEWMVEKIAKHDPRIKYFKMPENFGHDGRPKNMGLMNARGKYVAFLDDDDELFPDALKILHRYIDTTGVDMVYGDYLIHDETTGKITNGWSLDFSLQNLTNFNFITVGSSLINRTAILAVGGYDESIPRFKDWNTWIRMAKNGSQILHVPIPILMLIAHEKTISQKFQGETKYDENGRYLPTFFNPADCEIYANESIIGRPKPLKVAVITMTLDRLEYTKRMHQAMKKTAGYPFDWIVLDQNSQDGTKDFLKGKCTLIEETENIGIAKGWEKLAKHCLEKGYDIIIKVDNDCEMLSNNWLYLMVEIFKRNKKVILSPYIEGLDGSPGGVLRSRPDGKQPYVLINDMVMGMCPNLGGIVFASPKELYEGFKFPESLQGNKDYYLSQYARSLGYNLLYMEELRAFHIDTSEGQAKKYPEYFEKLYGKKG